MHQTGSQVLIAARNRGVENEGVKKIIGKHRVLLPECMGSDAQAEWEKQQ